MLMNLMCFRERERKRELKQFTEKVKCDDNKKGAYHL